MKLHEVVRGVEVKEYPKGIGSGVDEELEGYNSLASAEVVVDEKAIAMLMTKVSEDKYHGKAFTYNYMVDVIAQAIATAIESGAVLSLKKED